MGVAWGWESTCLHATFPALSPPFPTYYSIRSQILIVSSFLGEGTWFYPSAVSVGFVDCNLQQNQAPSPTCMITAACLKLRNCLLQSMLRNQRCSSVIRRSTSWCSRSCRSCRSRSFMKTWPKKPKNISMESFRDHKTNDLILLVSVSWMPRRKLSSWF